MSLRIRLLAAALALVTFGLVVADVATYNSLRSFLYERVDQQLAAAGRVAHDAILKSGRLLPRELRSLGTVVPGVFVEVRDLDNEPLVTVGGGRPGAQAFAPQLPSDVVALAPGYEGPVKPPRARLITVPGVNGGPDYRVRISTLIGEAVLIVALPFDEVAGTLRRLLVIELLVTVVVLVAATALGLWLVQIGLRPLVHIEATAGTIAAGDLSRRVTVDNPNTEVGRLGRALNIMLERIDAAFTQRRASEEAAQRSEQRMRQFVADASHELRTPVAAVRAYAELYRRGADRRPQDLARLLSRIEQETVRMGKLVDDLLLLTRLDEGRPLDLAPVDLATVAVEAVDAARAVEGDRPITLDVTGAVDVRGDRDRLRQVIDNLLANVRAHTPPKTPAVVRVFRTAERAVVEVADEGPGIDPEHAGRLFERFYRADPSRARDRGGSGLGLSIVAAIARAHGGRALAAPLPERGSVFRVELPLLDEVSA